MSNIFYRFADAVISIDPNEIKIPQKDLGPSTIQTGLSIIFGLGGAIAVVIILLAGLRFITSQGSPEGTTKARNTILYALIGLVVCVLAFTIVNFVLDSVI